ncbi:MAG: hypothetical protein IPL43_12135 [Micropruina sp.]|nr:hypothetical protein [Micropruina sp.]
MTTSEEDVPPVTAQDRAVVRAGDIVTVDVTANDFHPPATPWNCCPA